MRSPRRSGLGWQMGRGGTRLASTDLSGLNSVSSCAHVVPAFRSDEGTGLMGDFSPAFRGAERGHGVLLSWSSS